MLAYTVCTCKCVLACVFCIRMRTDEWVQCVCGLGILSPCACARCHFTSGLGKVTASHMPTPIFLLTVIVVFTGGGHADSKHERHDELGDSCLTAPVHSAAVSWGPCTYTVKTGKLWKHRRQKYNVTSPINQIADRSYLMAVFCFISQQEQNTEVQTQFSDNGSTLDTWCTKRCKATLRSLRSLIDSLSFH